MKSAEWIDKARVKQSKQRVYGKVKQQQRDVISNAGIDNLMGVHKKKRGRKKGK